MPQRLRAPLARALVFAFIAFLAAACATNPVTGKRELALISESQEIAMGRDADKEVAAAYGLYPDESLQQYLQALGTRIAAKTERPDLPWTFRVVDDASVNAFAIPGGFIYMTRGIMTHLNSEAELATILGHEIAHVTARHSVNQMSKQQLAQIGLVAGMVLSPRVAQLGDLAQTGLGLMFLSFSRSDESQSDELGLKYMMAAGYDPREVADVFRMLERVSQQSGAGRLPQWLSSHPNPENRQAWAERAAAAVGGNPSATTVNRESYLRRLDGMVFGENPREGFFEGSTFRHPDLAFRMTFPSGWKGSNQKQAVGAVSPNEDAVVVLQLAPGQSAQQAARQFFSQEGVQAGQAWRQQIGGFPAVSNVFQAQADRTIVQGVVAWVEYGNRVFQLLGYTPRERWSGYEQAFTQSIASFARETDSAVLNVQPHRLQLVELSRPATLDALLRQYPSTISPEVVALINDLEGNATLPAGAMFKRVVGGRAR
ncbi:MAG TPA: M48 family metalloprotease [Vicinamibacterales bacterium]|nr:M48 family metalloprotease [Vicinamibacterales bacterium]